MTDTELRDHVTHMDILVDIPDWTVAQMTNLLRLMCTRQHIIRKMLQSSMLYIDRDVVEHITQNLSICPADLEAAVHNATAEGHLQNFTIADSKAMLTISFSQRDENKLPSYVTFFKALLVQAKQASRVQLAVDDPTNEKYAARNLLLRIGMGGLKHKADRAALTGHLSGCTAFPNDDAMQAHRARQAAKRAARKENHDD